MVKWGNINKGRTLETLIFGAIWLVLFISPLIHELISYIGGRDFNWSQAYRFWMLLLPFFVLFLIHDLLFLPIYTKKGKGKTYAVLTALLIACFSFSQYHINKAIPHFRHETRMHMPPPQEGEAHPAHKPKPGKPHMAFPTMIDALLAMMLLGFNLAIVMVFKYHRAEEKRKQLESMRLQDELKYLKSQIDPHFFMNMLNNIHSMVDVDPEMAQQMILELSRLMRYVLYEGERSATTFDKEVQFVSNYVGLMRQRYPAEKVSISIDLPENPSHTLLLPPLLFISFVENAFKHGVSYIRKSEISVSLSEEDGRIYFKCSNSRMPASVAQEHSGGLGLVNARRRLDLLYQDRYHLEITESDDMYNVTLIIPGL